MTDVYIICSDGVFRRMLELELTEYGANVMPEGSAVTAPCAAVISAPDIDKAALPQDGCLTVVFGYPEELPDTDRINPSAVLVRPFDTDELMRVLFGESKTESVPTIRKITASGRLTVDIEKRTVSYLGISSRLTKREFALLNIFTNAKESKFREASFTTTCGVEATEKTSLTFTSAICAKSLKINSE